MKLIPLSKKGKKNAGKYYAQVDDADYDFLMQWDWAYLKIGNNEYATRQGKEGEARYVYMHRFILETKDKNTQIDHRDGNGLNCQRSNMRESTLAQNRCNRRIHKNKASKYLGVFIKDRKNIRYYARLTKNGKGIYAGSFKTELEAAMAYDKKALELHGEFARLNFPQI